MDLGSKVNLLCNPRIINNMKKAKKYIWVHCNGGKRFTNEVGTFGGYGVYGCDEEGPLK